MLLKQFQSYVDASGFFTQDSLLIIAVSGGADSVALCELCHRSGFSFEMAHCNFSLRGEESDHDETFVKALANQYNVPFHHIRFNTKEYAEENRVGTQLAARELRYEWFDQLIREKKTSQQRPVYLLTAHHANDNIETVLMQFFKGSGIQGLQGIPEKNGYIVRPLLFAKKADIIEYLKECNQSFVVDSSNLSDDYTRNFLRNQLIPSIEKVIPNTENNLLGNIERFKEVKLLYDEITGEKIKKLIELKGNEVHIPVLKLLKTHPVKTILYEVVKDYGFHPAQLDEILKLTESESGRFTASSSHRIFRNRAWLIITPLATTQSENIIIQETDDEIHFDGGAIKIERKVWSSSMKPSPERHIATIDASLLAFPLLLRKWKQGDYFYPFGMTKKKKLSRFFIDLKLSVPEKEKVWVLEQNKKIVWVVGLRSDNRFRVTDHTKEVVVFTFQPTTY